MLRQNVPKLPLPSTEALEHSAALLDLICQEIKSKGAISFARYMELALYAPGLGYYVAGSHKLGKSGDFVTAPLISPLFSACIARQACEIFMPIAGDILELGAGNGQMAVDILRTLASMQQLPAHYYILEVSPELRARQQELMQKEGVDKLTSIIWLDQLPTHFCGIIIANEVLDAMPVHRFMVTEQKIAEVGVIINEQSQLQWQLLPTATQAWQQQVASYQTTLPQPMPTGYISEINATIPAFVASLSDCLQQGAILLIDYGFERDTYYHPSRNQGTLMCHYRHYAHDNPFFYPGLQDITAHVDFTAIEQAAVAQQLTVAGYASQAQFLLGMGILEEATLLLQQADEITRLRLSQQIQQLTAPHEMGELFKVMLLTRL